MPDENEWLNAEDVRLELRATPEEFRHLLETGALETDFERGRAFHSDYSMGETPFFRGDVRDVRIHVFSYERFCSYNEIESDLLSANNRPTQQVVATEKDEGAQEQLKDSTAAVKKKATVKDYEDRMTEIVSAVLAIKKDWDNASSNSQKRKHGFTEGDIEALLPDLAVRLRRAIKKALPENGIKVWPHNHARPS